MVEVQKRGTSKSLSKQACTIADSSGNTILVLWEDDIGRVEKGVSDGVTVRSFQSLNYLTVSSASTCNIVVIEDIDVEGPESDIDELAALRCVKDLYKALKARSLLLQKLNPTRAAFCVSLK